MHLAYSFKIMARLPWDSPIELFRSSLPYSQASWNFHTRGLDAAWTKWTEHTLTDGQTITERVKTVRPGHSGVKVKVTEGV